MRYVAHRPRAYADPRALLRLRHPFPHLRRRGRFPLSLGRLLCRGRPDGALLDAYLYRHSGRRSGLRLEEGSPGVEVNENEAPQPEGQTNTAEPAPAVTPPQDQAPVADVAATSEGGAATLASEPTNTGSATPPSEPAASAAERPARPERPATPVGDVPGRVPAPAADAAVAVAPVRISQGVMIEMGRLQPVEI